MKPIRVRFLGREEIRMGSPYAICRVSLRGRGCCRSIAWEDGQVLYSAFAEIRGSYAPPER